MRGVPASRLSLRSGRGAEGGFSVIDVLVSVAVMVVLLSILLPAMQMAHESARRVRCASNVRQMGIAIGTFANDHRDLLPPALFESQPPLQSQNRAMGRGQTPDSGSSGTHLPHDDEGTDTMFLRYASPNPDQSEPLWDGLGILARDGYLNHPGVFYCPSHHGDHPFTQYVNEWTVGQGLIAANYQYRVPFRATYLSDLDRRTAIVADGMRTRGDYNHVNGNNFLRADLSVGWYADVNGVLYRSLPESVDVETGGPGSVNPWETIENVN